MRPDGAEVAAVYRGGRRGQHLLRVDGAAVARRAAPREGERRVVRRNRRRGVRQVPVGRVAVRRRAVDRRRHRLQARALALWGTLAPIRIEYLFSMVDLISCYRVAAKSDLKNNGPNGTCRLVGPVQPIILHILCLTF